MTRRSILGYVQAIRARYLRSSRLEKGKILDEFVQVTGMHRRAAIRFVKQYQAAQGPQEAWSEA